MNREILFRGKVFNKMPDLTYQDCGWVYGYYHCEYNGNFYSFISVIDDKNAETNIYSVEENTVGQFTGLLDKNGKKIFEGDIIQFGTGVFLPGTEEFGTIKFDCGVFGIEWKKNTKSMKGSFGQRHNLRKMDDDLDPSKDLIVIGNVYENENLLK